MCARLTVGHVLDSVVRGLNKSLFIELCCAMSLACIAFALNDDRLQAQGILAAAEHGGDYVGIVTGRAGEGHLVVDGEIIKTALPLNIVLRRGCERCK